MPETPFAQWLKAELEARKSNPSKLAAAIGAARQTVNAWFASGRQASPELCVLVANYLHVPIELVMVKAGHLPEDYPVPESDLPGFLREALTGLSEADLHVVAATARGLHEVRRQFPTDEDLRNAE